METGEQVALGGQLRVIDDLQQQIAELVGKIVEISALDRVGDTVSPFIPPASDRSSMLLKTPKHG